MAKPVSSSSVIIFMPPTFLVNGTYGTVTVDLATGNVLAYDPMCDEPSYADIVRFDVARFERVYELTLVEGDELDILGIGFWTADGEYFDPPDEDPVADLVTSDDDGMDR